MISEATIDTAIAKGHISAEQARLLRDLEAASGDAPVTPDDEKLRFITGFADIFVAIGIGLFLGASAYFIQDAAGNAAMGAGLAVLSWMLAEFFTRRRRQAFPSIILLLTYTSCVFLGILFWLGPLLGGTKDDWGAFDTKSSVVAIAGIGAALATALHYIRFRVPITIAAGAGALFTIPIFLAAASADKNPLPLAGVIFICGLSAFALAMRFDISDPGRLTRRTDIAFWLHLLAAPLIVHSLILGFFGTRSLSELELPQAALILATFLILALIAIIIDRRAILVSGLSYAGYAFGSLIAKSSLGSNSVPATLLALGTFVLLLSALWQPLRRAVLRLFPDSFTRRLPRSQLQGS